MLGFLNPVGTLLGFLEIEELMLNSVTKIYHHSSHFRQIQVHIQVQTA